MSPLIREYFLIPSYNIKLETPATPIIAIREIISTYSDMGLGTENLKESVYNMRVLFA